MITEIKQVPVDSEIEPTTDHTELIEQLAGLSAIAYDQQRDAIAKQLKCRAPTLDKLVSSRRKEIESERDTGVSELYHGIEPWGSPVDGEQLVSDIRALLQRHSVMPDGGHTAITLWILGSYSFDSFRIFPKLCLSSPEKRCGKTTTLEVISAIVRRVLMCSNTSAATIFRAVDEWQPTMLIDEGDTFLTGNEELRGIINSGHTRATATVLRVEEVNGQREPKQFSTWAPMAIAMIKEPPDTIRDRSIMVSLRRKLPNESVERVPIDLMDDCRVLRRKCQRWADDNAEKLKVCRPTVPNLASDRAEDNWLPLLAIAESIGNECANEARQAAVLLTPVDHDGESIGPMILTDIRQILEARSLDKLHSDELVTELVELEERPWCEWKHGKPLTKNSLARMLKPFKIKSKQLRIGHINRNGYELADFEDAFTRYLAPTAENTPFQNSTTLQAALHAGCSDSGNSTEPDRVEFPDRLEAPDYGGCRGVEFQNEGERESGRELLGFADAAEGAI